MRLLVRDHLDAVLGPPQVFVGEDQRLGDLGRNPARRGQLPKGQAGSDGPESRVGAAPDELVRLSEELDLADAPAPELEILAGFPDLPAAMLGVDPLLDVVQGLHRGKVQSLPPHERR